ncbi:hypothetical protein BGZ76_010431 [Entomortierella beljakovae]|nr:hypothetical protein BGZ76_010431 [Entomortierella beljakovae]
MNTVETSTQKRKAPPTEEEEPSSKSIEQPDSKKARNNTNAAAKGGGGGGETLLVKDAVELYQMAREEILSSTIITSSFESGFGPGKLSRMAKALFDKAIQEFEILEKENAHIELTDGTEVTKQVVETKIHHAACVIAMGNHIPSLELLQEGTRMFEDLAKKTGYENGNVLVGLGIAEISQAREIRKQVMKDVEPMDDDVDTFITEEQRDAAALVGRSEVKLVRSSLDNFNKGLNLLKDKENQEQVFSQESIRTAQELEEYSIAMDIKINKDLATSIIDEAIRHLDEAKEKLPSSVESNPDILCLYGSCLFSKAKLVDNQGCGDENPATRIVDKAIEVLINAESMQAEEGDSKTFETLGYVYLMSVNLVEDDDLIMERIDAAKEKLSKALELNPDNYALEAQVEALRGDEGEFEEDFEGQSENEVEVNSEGADVDQD